MVTVNNSQVYSVCFLPLYGHQLVSTNHTIVCNMCVCVCVCVCVCMCVCMCVYVCVCVLSTLFLCEFAHRCLYLELRER